MNAHLVSRVGLSLGALAMPLQNFFEEQTRTLRIFLNTRGGPRLRVLLTDPDTRAVTHRLLAGMESDERVRGVFIPSDAPFTDRAAYVERVYADLVESYTPFAAELASEYVLSPPGWATLKAADPAERFTRGAAMFANSLPDELGSVAFLLDPADVADPRGYRQVLRFLAEHTPSDRVKYVVLDDRIGGHTPELVKELPAIGVQSMYLAPDEMESRARWALATGIGVGPIERRAYTGLLASFAFSRKQYDEALRLQHEQLEMTRAEGTPNDLAAVHYNLGNTHLAKKDLTAAVESFNEALSLALRTGLTAIVPMVLTNLGVALFQAEATPQAEHCFQTARTYAQKLNLPPMEAHVLDCMARGHLAAGRPAEAERCWKDALAVYGEITAESMRFARDGGRKDILLKLEQHYLATRQPDKLAALRGEVARGHS